MTALLLDKGHGAGPQRAPAHVRLCPFSRLRCRRRTEAVLHGNRRRACRRRTGPAGRPRGPGGADPEPARLAPPLYLCPAVIPRTPRLAGCSLAPGASHSASRTKEPHR